MIGGGVAGIVAAYLLSSKFTVTLIEAADYIGGHTNTITLPHGPDTGTPVDTGFIVLNDRNYPNFQKFLAQLNVTVRKSEMSFSFYCRQSGLCYSSKFPDGVFAQRQNLLRPTFLRMLADIVRFNRQAVRDLHSGAINGQSLGEYLTVNRYTNAFVEHHLIPTAAAIWSSPPAAVREFPMAAFVRFYDNHGLLSLTDRPQWFTVTGGSQVYVQQFLAQFPGQVMTDSPVVAVTRQPSGVQVTLTDRRTLTFDKVVIATHADQALTMLTDPSPAEQRLLGAWTYLKNWTVLHTDSSVMSPNRRVWSSWNYIRSRQTDATHPVSVTYYMNRLQGLTTNRDYFVTLNAPQPIPQAHIITELEYTHPGYTFDSLASQADLPSLNGQRQTYFCGSYFGYGFHEDAVKSAVAVAQQFDLSL